jgi:hypothetical protein
MRENYQCAGKKYGYGLDRGSFQVLKKFPVIEEL